jgi:hypothetical protein
MAVMVGLFCGAPRLIVFLAHNVPLVLVRAIRELAHHDLASKLDLLLQEPNLLKEGEVLSL